MWSPELMLFVVVWTESVSSGNVVIATSRDGFIWTLAPSVPQNNLISVTWSPELSLFVAVNWIGWFLTSRNGTSWTRQNPQFSDFRVQKIIWSSDLGLFVAVGQSGANRVFISSNGINWSPINVPLNAWHYVVYSHERRLLVAVAMSGEVMTSVNGRDWSLVEISDFPHSWRCIAWSEDIGYFVTVAEDGHIAYSNDGFIWTVDKLIGAHSNVHWSKELNKFIIMNNGSSIATMQFVTVPNDRVKDYRE